MPGLHELLDFVYRHAEQGGHALPPAMQQTLEAAIRKTWPGQRVYVAPHDSRKDSKRAQTIKQATKCLPTGVVASRYGVSRQYVHRLVKK